MWSEAEQITAAYNPSPLTVDPNGGPLLEQDPVQYYATLLVAEVLYKFTHSPDRYAEAVATARQLAAERTGGRR